MGDKIDLNLMQVFDAVMRERSVSRAAERLSIGQPAASAALARLRALFGDELFVRDTAGMRPTSRAVAAYPQITEALKLIGDAVRPVSRFEPAASRQCFRISGGDYAAMVLLPRLYALVRAHAPHVDLRFRSVEKDAVPPLLENGSLDLAIGVFPEPPKSLVASTLIEDDFICLMRRGAAAGVDRQGAMGLDAYCALPHILVTERNDETGVVDEALRRLGRSRRVALTVSHLLTVPVLVAGSDSVATVGRHVGVICREAFAGLAMLEPPLALGRFALAQLWARHRAGDAGLDWLRGQVAAAAGTPPSPPFAAA